MPVKILKPFWLSANVYQTIYDLGTDRWRRPSCFLSRNELDTQLNLSQQTFAENLPCASYSPRAGNSVSTRMLSAARKRLFSGFSENKEIRYQTAEVGLMQVWHRALAPLL